MTMKFRKIWLAVASTAALTLAGCGGGSSTISGGELTSPPGGGGGGVGGGNITPSAAAFSGTAATGAALANAGVAITNSSGNSPCLEASITTTALGSYTCTLKTGETAPFFIVVTDPTGNTQPLVSVATSTPAAGTPLTINVTPLTTAIVAQLAPDGNPLTLVNSRAVDAAALKQLTANVVAQLANVLTAVGAPAGYDPFTTSITAATASATGNTADMVLDVVKVVTDPATGKLALNTVDNPTPIVLATATTPGTTMGTPAVGVSTLSQAAQIAAQAFTACFAVPTAQRVLAKDDAVIASLGGPTVTAVAPACENIAGSSANAAGIDFLHNGYNDGQFFYGLLTSSTMTGAQFSVPEIMAFYPADTTATAPAAAAYDRAVLNIKFLDNAGNPGNVVTVAAKIPNSSSTTRPTEWWLVGNRQAVDVGVRLNIRRVEQLNTASTNTNRMSTFQTGIQFNVNAKGPGSLATTTTPLTLARVTGPGLPSAGLVYKTSSGAQSSMDLWNKTGSLNTGSLCGNNGATVNCPNYWFARTAGVAGPDAATLTANPSNGGNILIWAQSTNEVDTTQFVKGSMYRIELFYGLNTGTADVTMSKTLLSDLVQATRAVYLPWNTLGAQSLAALDPNGSLTGIQDNLPLDWVQNLSAQQVGGVSAVINTTSGSFGPNRFVPRGATSAILDNQTVPAFTATAANRTLLFGYRMLDTSNKTAVYQYN
ncbi:MAG: hypothetical protein B7X59_08720 [Polaromonas sp. 39-63-203]|jgi:hypothetical protein|uniref:hypothetical protein n=1 Tax=Polaromonas sp. TaxID=1869339 RepID=UPI000BD122EF|nr:hypothetical protein [Polaromonas sp.]OYY51959.1 MAG: hypothetical protein B7Y54_08600 [Polaromonas sp. 35-63-240]OYZ83460.1 MAG: hypothetical protein B7Y03_09065 [Polaromonas sp. 24-62-144]OZA97007.1 MAG: hypothetical protein B7X59_08720 [Polaromonas sp. 39-63-203]HQS31246.1 hypothetical protein [Polaromonas sp.]